MSDTPEVKDELRHLGIEIIVRCVHLTGNRRVKRHEERVGFFDPRTEWQKAISEADHALHRMINAAIEEENRRQAREKAGKERAAGKKTKKQKLLEEEIARQEDNAAAPAPPESGTLFDHVTEGENHVSEGR